ncbi:MAG: tail fiber domain-containing protein [Planctomycetota bacterium]|jgi:hypothetical protein
MFRVTAIVVTAVIAAATLTPAAPARVDLDSTFTYQGRLDDNGVPADGAYDLQFTLWDAVSAGIQVGSTVSVLQVPVSDGLFTVEIDFGEGVFDGAARWLQVVVDGVALSPRQPITAAPYAQAIRGLRAAPSGNPQFPDRVNLIGGHADNSVASGVEGATISGGGVQFNGNSVLDDFGTVGGGIGNTADGHASVVAGGSGNSAAYTNCTVGGGSLNVASGAWATVAGGQVNIASGQQATVAGGYVNAASGEWSSVPGGTLNQAGGNYSLAGGHRATVRNAGQSGDGDGDEGTFVWADSTNSDFVSTGPDQFLIRAAGGVGIGTNAPTSILHLRNGGPDIAIRMKSQGSWTAERRQTNASLLSLVNGGSERLTIDPGGAVGIGTLAPTHRLTVNGAAANTTGVWAVFSDERLKQDVEPLAGSLDRLTALDGVSFTYTEDAPIDAPGRRAGLVAQQVEPVFPEWVRETGTGLKMLEMTGFEAHVVEALKTLRAENVALRAANAALEARLAGIEARLARTGPGGDGGAP